MTDTNVAIVGAGPYGLAAAAHLRRAGVEVRVIGQPMSFWQNTARRPAAALQLDGHLHRGIRGRAVPGLVLRRHRRQLRLAGTAGPLHRLRHVGAAASRAGRGPPPGAGAGSRPRRIPAHPR